MNKLILSAFVAVSLLVTHVHWSSGHLDTFLDDFVSWPNLKAKRDLEFEEFLKDGNIHEAKKRALHRQKRRNEADMSETLKRYRRSLLEEDEEGEHEAVLKCRAAEKNRKRDDNDCMECVPFVHPIKWWFDTSGGCSDETKARFKEAMEFYTQNSQCEYAESETTQANADIWIQCSDVGNYAPIGFTSFNTVNVEQPYNNKAGKKVISHEVAHVCCLDHAQKNKGAGYWENYNKGCVLTDYWAQYEPYTCAASNCNQLLDPDWDWFKVDLASNMQYPPTGFLAEGCETNIETRCPSKGIGVMNARKSPWYSDIKLISESYCQLCDSQDYPDLTVPGKDCEVLEMYNLIYATSTEKVDDVAYCLLQSTVKVIAGELKIIQCGNPESQMTIGSSLWSGIPSSTYCKNSNLRGFGFTGNEVAEMVLVCGDGSDNVCRHILTPSVGDKGTWFVIDAINTGSGEITFEISCCSM